MATNTATQRFLPVGIQDFRKIREKGYIYVDKTPQVYPLITGIEGAFFLSRPRRFGKSLLCSTLGAIFEGRRELFGEIAGRPALALDSLDWEWKTHPVIYLDLYAGNYCDGKPVLNTVLQNKLENCARHYKVALRGQTVPMQFENLIVDLHEHTGEETVIIIDEYDSPLTGTLLEPTIHVQLRNELKTFYGVMKSCDAHLRFILLTGVSKFSHVSIFSGLNQITDLTFDPRYADICGLTEEEITANFVPEIDGILKTSGYSREEYIEKLRRFYNGYRFSDDPLTVYNPFGMLNHFEHNGKFEDYWYDTATPSFLVELIEKKKINVLNMNNMQVRNIDFSKYDIDHMTPAPILCQTGYLTISGYNAETGVYTLDFPNNEVRASFAGTLVRHYVGAADDERLDLKLLSALAEGNLDAAMDTLSRFFATIPYEIVVEKEMYFQTVVHLLFTMLNFNCRSEVRIATGRIDTLVVTKNFVYCFEFKLDGTAEAALAQIDSKEYAVPWTGRGKKVFKVGVNFDFEKRNIGEWVSVASGQV
jgi:hypothetical protein